MLVAYSVVFLHGDCVKERSAEESIWNLEGESDRRMDNCT
jgi:hypothetical protein